MQRAARRANGLQPLAARVRHAAHHTPATGCALLQRTAMRCKRCNRSQQSAVCCNRRHCVATARLRCWSVAAECCNHRCNRLQRAVVCCNGLWSVAADRTELPSSLQLVATGCGLLQPDCTVLPSSLQPVTTGCGLWQQAVVCCQRIALCCNHRCNRLQRAEVRCKLLCSVATDGTPLQQVVMRCNQSGCGVAARATGAVSMSSALS